MITEQDNFHIISIIFSKRKTKQLCVLITLITRLKVNNCNYIEINDTLENDLAFRMINFSKLLRKYTNFAEEINFNRDYEKSWN